MRISDWSSDVCSSDLQPAEARASLRHRGAADPALPLAAALRVRLRQAGAGRLPPPAQAAPRHDLRGRRRPHGELPPGADRSEEHTSELQSLMRISYAVFFLKKKFLITFPFFFFLLTNFFFFFLS